MGGCVCGVRGCVSAWLWVYVWGVHAMPNGIVCVLVFVFVRRVMMMGLRILIAKNE